MLAKYEGNGRWPQDVMGAFRALRGGFGNECWFVEGAGFL